MEDRQPLIDPQTYEILLEVYKIVAAADNDSAGSINPSDLTYIHGQLKSVLTLNSIPAVDPRSDPKVIDSIKKLGRKLLP